MNYPQPQSGIDDGWPWNCTLCGRTIYHDAPACRDCDRMERASSAADPRWRAYVRSIAGWMRVQSYLGFVARISTIAGIEVLLTALWIRILFSGTVPIPV